MTTTCQINQEALNQCSRAVTDLQEAVKRHQELQEQYTRDYNQYIINLQQWESGLAQITALRDSGYQSAHGFVFAADGTHTDCSTTLGGSKICCKHVSNIRQRCKACGYGGNCTRCLGSTGVAGEEHCAEFRRSPYSRFQWEYNTWIQTHSQPKPPVAPLPASFPSIVCATCVQCAQFDNLRAGRDINLAENAVSLQQSCVASMQQQLTEEERAAAEAAAAKAAQEQAAAAAAAEAAAARAAQEQAAARAAQEQAAREQAAARAAQEQPATRATQEQETADSLKRADEMLVKDRARMAAAAEARKKRMIIFFIVLVAVIVIGLIVGGTVYFTMYAGEDMWEN